MSSANQPVRQGRFRYPPGATRILLVRHGESAAAHEGEPFPLVGGQGDPPLHPNGIRQAVAVGARLQHRHIDVITVTNLQRTAQTAAPLATALGITPVVVDDLREVHLGEWEGGEYRYRAASNDPTYQAFRASGRWEIIPGAENTDDFTTRVTAALFALAEANPDRTVAVFTHGGVIGQVAEHASGAAPLSFYGADNASITELAVIGNVMRLRRFNDIAHLEDLPDF